MDSMEPMDIDRSGSSASKMDISFNESAAEIHEVLDDDDDCIYLGRSPISSSYEKPKQRRVVVKTEKIDTDGDSETQIKNFKKSETDLKPSRSLKKYHIKIERPKKKPSSKYKWIILGILSICFFISYAINQIFNVKCAEELDLKNLEKTFSDNLFGQSIAAGKIIGALNNDVSSKIIFLYGSTGVGKTYATSLMLENVRNAANIYHYTMPSFAYNFSPEMMLGLIMCKSTVLVVDGLNRNDMHITSHIKELIIKSENLKKKLTVILIYNCDEITNDFVKKCDDLFQAELESNYRHIGTHKHYIQFQPLTQDHLVKCIEKELKYRKLSRQDMDTILKNFDVNLDGCKGVYTKIKYYNII